MKHLLWWQHHRQAVSCVFLSPHTSSPHHPHIVCLLTFYVLRSVRLFSVLQYTIFIRIAPPVCKQDMKWVHYDGHKICHLTDAHFLSWAPSPCSEHARFTYSIMPYICILSKHRTIRRNLKIYVQITRQTSHYFIYC